MRAEILKIFFSEISKNVRLDSIKAVAVVGGRLTEPEVTVLNLGKDVLIDSFGIDQNSKYFFDLNASNEKFQKNNSYDLIICAQVLEHIWDLNQAVKNLSYLCKTNGLIWLNCPTSNRVHFAPDYYSAGYPPVTLINHLTQNNSKILSFGVLGSPRYYFMNHALSVWTTSAEHKHPILKYEFGRLPGPIFIDLLRFIRDFPNRLIALTKSSNITSDIRWATETWVLAKKSQ